jgi:hypothetical protein
VVPHRIVDAQPDKPAEQQIELRAWCTFNISTIGVGCG